MDVEDKSHDERASRWARAVKPRNPLQAIKRTAFEVNPPYLELGELPLGRTYRCALRIRNAGDTDVRTRVWLEPPHAEKESEWIEKDVPKSRSTWAIPSDA